MVKKCLRGLWGKKRTNGEISNVSNEQTLNIKFKSSQSPNLGFLSLPFTRPVSIAYSRSIAISEAARQTCSPGLAVQTLLHRNTFLLESLHEHESLYKLIRWLSESKKIMQHRFCIACFVLTENPRSTFIASLAIAENFFGPMNIYMKRMRWRPLRNR